MNSYQLSIIFSYGSAFIFRIWTFYLFGIEKIIEVSSKHGVYSTFLLFMFILFISSGCMHSIVATFFSCYIETPKSTKREIALYRLNRTVWSCNVYPTIYLDLFYFFSSFFFLFFYFVLFYLHLQPDYEILRTNENDVSMCINVSSCGKLLLFFFSSSSSSSCDGKFIYIGIL